MQISQIATLGLFGLALAKPLQQKRSASDVEGDIATLSSGLSAFDDAVNSFAGSISNDQANDFLATYVGLQAFISQATSDIKSTGSLSYSDSDTIHSAADSLTTQVVDNLNNILSKQSVVESSGYISQVCGGLSTFNTQTDAFYQALEISIDSAFTSDVTSLQTTVDSSFTATVKKYRC